MKTFRNLLVVFLLLLAACSALPHHKDDLAKKNEDFMLRVRWLNFPGAALHFDGENRPGFIERFADVDDLKVTEFTTVRINIDEPQEKVTVYYQLKYYMLPSATIKKKRFTLTWEQQPDKVSGEAFWRITEPFPELP